MCKWAKLYNESGYISKEKREKILSSFGLQSKRIDKTSCLLTKHATVERALDSVNSLQT
jgi:hypothetical protein